MKILEIGDSRYYTTRKPVIAKINLFKLFPIFLSTQNYFILETIHNEKKTVKKTKTATNTLFPYCPRSIILESLFLNTCCLGQKV